MSYAAPFEDMFCNLLDKREFMRGLRGGGAYGGSKVLLCRGGARGVGAILHGSHYDYIYTSVDPCIYMHGAKQSRVQ